MDEFERMRKALLDALEEEAAKSGGASLQVHLHLHGPVTIFHGAATPARPAAFTPRLGGLQKRRQRRPKVAEG